MSALTHTSPPTRQSLWRRRETGLLFALIVVVAGVSLFRPDFLSLQNFRDILLSAAVPALVAAGMTAVIVAGGIDISVGSQLGVCAVVGALAAKQGLPLPLVALLAMAVGTLLGSFNGFLVARLRIPAIVATLATMGGIRGALAWVTKGYTVSGLPESLRSFGSSYWPGGGGFVLALPGSVWIAAGGILIAGLLMARSSLGRALYAVGGSPRAAELSGINVRRMQFGSFAALGALVGLGAFLRMSRFSVIQPGFGNGFELHVITAVVVGGTDIFGGRGTVLGSVLGALVVAVISPALVYLEQQTKLGSEVQPAVQGMLILLVVLADHWRRRNESGEDG